MSADKKSTKKSQGLTKAERAAALQASSASIAATVDDNACVVCFKTVDIFSIGECDHPVCYECSTRMRVLCEQNECPICRQVLSKVIFTYDKLSYRELEAKNRSEYYSKKYKVCFYTSDIQQKFFELLDHPCPKCSCPPYRTFQGLRNHVRKEHDHHYCDLCVENLKIFTFERRCYTQAELGIHRTKGDPDNRSHRGHPLCEYCNKRYLDRDELFRHLRREHYYCHFCDADGCNEFYRDYSALADHFRQDHFLCEEGKCATEEFTGAFRSEIDFKAHVASVHGRGMNKQQAKQTRTLQLEITLGPRGRSGQTEQGVANMRSRGGNNNNNEVEPEIEESTYNQPSHMQARQNINPGSEQEFPSLAGGSSGPSLSLTRPPPPTIINHNRVSGLARTKENFPALGGGISGVGDGGGVTTTKSSSQQQPISAMLKKKPTSATGAIPRTATPKNTPTSGSGMVIHVSNRPANNANSAGTTKKASAMDFPALPAGKSKKGKAAALNEDMPSSGVQLPVSSVAAKHRTLVDDYVSVANPANFQKIQMVQKEELEAKQRKEAAARSAPKLTTQDFPSLGGSGPARQSVPTNTWVKAVVNERISEKRQKELENRKSKVAPAPVLPKANSYTAPKPAPVITNGNAHSNASNSNASNKKDKKPKDKKVKETSNNNNNENKATNNNLTNSNNNQKPAAAASPPRSPQTSKSPPEEYHSNVTVNSVAKSPNNLTFTSSLGESYSILPAHTFTPPTDAMLRNQRLILYFRDILESMEALEEFRYISQMYRDSVVKADSYYEHCQAALKDKFDGVFPELVVLLPDISKQQGLYLVHQQRLNTMPPAQRKALPTMDVCSTCKQVLLPVDMGDHLKMHEIVQNFPELSGNRKSITKA